jgi:hypothetical protein
MNHVLCRPQEVLRTSSLLAAACALLVGPPAFGQILSDPIDDFLATFTGPQSPDLDVLSVSATFTSSGVTLTSTQSGDIGTTPTALYLWGVDRGSGTDRLISSGPPAVGAADILLDVVRLEPNGGGRVVLFPSIGAPITTLLDPSMITIAGRNHLRVRRLRPHAVDRPSGSRLHIRLLDAFGVRRRQPDLHRRPSPRRSQLRRRGGARTHLMDSLGTRVRYRGLPRSAQP